MSLKKYGIFKAMGGPKRKSLRGGGMDIFWNYTLPLLSNGNLVSPMNGFEQFFPVMSNIINQSKTWSLVSIILLFAFI